MGLYTTELKTICESILMHSVLNPQTNQRLTVEDMLSDPAYKYGYDGQRYTPYYIAQFEGVQKRIFGEPSGLDCYPIFDEDYRKELQKKILLKYYTREICEETFGLWKLRLNSKMNEIMPYYNQLYSETYEKYLGSDYNLFFNHDTETVEEFDKKLNRMIENILNENVTSDSTGKETNSGSDTTKYGKKYWKKLGGAGFKDTHGNNGLTTVESDTPQGEVHFNFTPDPQDTQPATEAVVVNGYASKISTQKGVILNRNYQNDISEPEIYKEGEYDRDGRAVSGGNSQDEYVHGHIVDSTDNTTRDTTSSNKERGNENENRSINKTVKGKTNNISYAKLIKEIRESIINVDQLVMRELEPLFIGLW